MYEYERKAIAQERLAAYISVTLSVFTVTSLCHCTWLTGKKVKAFVSMTVSQIHDIVLILTHYSSVRDASKSEASLQRSILYVMCHLAISYLQRKV